MSQYSSDLREEPLIIESGKPGPTVMILGGIHGDELCGTEAVCRLMKNPPRIDQGKLIVMYGNLHAIKQKVRQTEANLNRMFLNDEIYSEEQKQTYEYKRAQQIKPYLEQSDILLDIHSVFDPNGTPFIICENNGGEIAQYLPFPIRCSGFDNAHPGGTDGYMNSLGKIGICIECGYHNDPLASERAMNSIDIFLKVVGLQNEDASPTINRVQRSLHVNFIYSNQYAPFTLVQPFRDFQTVKEGELIGYDGDHEIKSEKDQIIVFARERSEPYKEAFCYAEEA